MKKILQSTLSVLLVLVMVLQIFPASIFATEEGSTSPAGGLSDDELMLTDAEALADEAAQQPAEILFEEESLREENVKHFRLSDGTYIAVDYQQPVHYAAADGSWQDIDNRLTATVSTRNGAAAYTSTIGSYQKAFSRAL